jgi:pyridoxamine 5'-phosphate oxidase family protein
MRGSEKLQGSARAVFKEAEAEYLAENFLGRVATSSASGQPHVVPVVYSFDGSTITFGGWRLTKSLKFRNLSANGKAAFVVDDLVSAKPWMARGVEVRGRAELVQSDGGVSMVRIIPLNISSWGLEARAK